MASKYAPLQRYLKQTEGRRVRLSFREVEAVLGFELPGSAKTYAQWWANVGGSHVQADAWMGAGWRTCDVDVPGGRLSFERNAAAPGHSRPDSSAHGVEETGSPFVLDATIEIDRAALTSGAIRLLEDYCEERGGTLAEAIAGLLNTMALERRRQLIEWFRKNAPPVQGDSTDIIREERDAR